ncbi:MAG: hypothetical protein RL017_327, partial [Pseudomonadota bacterium]
MKQIKSLSYKNLLIFFINNKILILIIMASLLLIDSRIHDKDTVLASLLPSVDYLVVNYYIDTLETIKQQIPKEKKYESIGIFQENYEMTFYKFALSFGICKLQDIEAVDPKLDSWKSYIDMLLYFKDVLGMTTLDLMGCSIFSNPNWDYVMSKIQTDYGIQINSSSDNTGSRDLGGNWILEDGNKDLVGTYFTENILKYDFILGTTSLHTGVVTDRGYVAVWGNNSSGQLGDGTTTNRLKPVYMLDNAANSTAPFFNACAVSCGFNHTLVLSYNGNLYTCGLNDQGQFGNGTTSTTAQTRLSLIVNPASGVYVVSIAAGYKTSFFSVNKGYPYSAGLNDKGQLGRGTAANYNTFGNAIPQVNGSGSLNYIKGVWAGYQNSAVNQFTGQTQNTLTMGDNTNGQRGNGTTATGSNYVSLLAQQNSKDPSTYTKSVAFTRSSTIICRDVKIGELSGSIICFGKNFYGEFGNGTTTQSASPVIMKKIEDSTQNIPDNSTFMVSAGNSHIEILNKDGSAAWVGKIGDDYSSIYTSTTTPIYHRIPASVTAYTSTTQCDLTIPQNFKEVCGYSGYIETDSNAVNSFIYSGSLLLTENGDVYCFGIDNCGQYGNNTTNFIETGQTKPSSFTPVPSNLCNVYALAHGNNVSFNYYTNAGQNTNGSISSLATMATLDISSYYKGFNGSKNPTPTDLKIAGFSLASIKSYNAGLTTPKYTVNDLLSAGYPIIDCINAGYTQSQIVGAEYYTAGELKAQAAVSGKWTVMTDGSITSTNQTVNGRKYPAKLFRINMENLNGGYTVSQLLTPIYMGGSTFVSYTKIEVAQAGYTIVELKAAGFTLSNLKNASINLYDILTQYTYKECIDAGFTTTNLLLPTKNVYKYKYSFNNFGTGFTGFSPSELKQIYTLDEIIANETSIFKLLNNYAFTLNDIMLKLPTTTIN